MSHRLTGFVAAIFLLLGVSANATEPVDAVSVFISQLGPLESARMQALTVLSGLKNNDQKLSTCTSSARAQVALLEKDSKELRSMTLTGDIASVVSDYAKLYDIAAADVFQLGVICTAVRANKTDAEAAPILEESGKILASLAAIEQQRFKGIPLLAAALLEKGGDVRTAKLTISSLQREQLVEGIDNAFPARFEGKTMKQIADANPGNYIIASAAVLRSFLRSRKATDED